MEQPWVELERLTARLLELAIANAWEELDSLTGALNAARAADAAWVEIHPQAAGNPERARALQQAAENLQAIATHVLPAHRSMGKLLKALGTHAG